MANNRMYLECEGCGEKIFIAKRYGDEYNTYGHLKIAELNDFFEKHYYCKDASIDGFKLVYEFPPGED